MRHLVTLDDVSAPELESILAIAADLKSKFKQGIREPLLPGRVLALLFEKQSLRTRVSFEACMTHLGGGSLMLGADTGFGGKRESMEDFSRVLSTMVDAVVIRSKRHETVAEFAQYATCSVINGLTDLAHPCQAVADLFTLRERFGDLKGRKLTWIGDGNNVAVSLARACAKLDVEFVAASPAGYELSAELVNEIGSDSVSVTNDPRQAVEGSSAIYTDVWASMGQEAEEEQRRKDFAPYQVNEALFNAAPDDAVFMHCLPAKRGEEVTNEVIDHERSVIVPQAENRMHAQKAILVWLLGSHAAG